MQIDVSHIKVNNIIDDNDDNDHDVNIGQLS